MPKKLSNTAILNYKIVNYILLAVFVVGLLFVLFSPINISCYYTQTYGISCPTCGLTRDFKAILNGNTTDLISSSSLFFFSAFSCLFISRILSSILMSFRSNLYVFVVFETIVIFSILTLLILARI